MRTYFAQLQPVRDTLRGQESSRQMIQRTSFATMRPQRQDAHVIVRLYENVAQDALTDWIVLRVEPVKPVKRLAVLKMEGIKHALP